MPSWERYVLVVEDDAALREHYRSTLRAAGYAVVGVEDGLDALRRIDTEKPKAVVLDLGLPRLNGRALSRELRAHPQTQDIPVIVVTGTDTSDLNPDQFAGILRKPIDPDALVQAVQKCVRKQSV
jgi:two-component system OmpR family response regulator